MPLLPALGRQRQADLCEARLVHRVSSKIGRATQGNTVSKIKTIVKTYIHHMNISTFLAM